MGRCSGDWEGTQEGVMALPCFLLSSGQICAWVYQEVNCKTAPLYQTQMVVQVDAGGD